MANIVLVHGMWGDGSGWAGVIPLLQDAGHTVVAVQNPLDSLAGDIEHTRDVLDRLDGGPTVLAGHSYGGAVISGAAAGRPEVRALGFVAAWALDEGETIAGLFEQSPPLESTRHVQPDAHGRVWLDPAHFHEDFCQDVDETASRVMAAVQNPPAGSILGEPLHGEPAWRTLPSWYQVSEQDHMIPPELEHRFADRMGARTVSIDASHASMVSHPREVAAMLMEAAETA